MIRIGSSSGPNVRILYDEDKNNYPFGYLQFNDAQQWDLYVWMSHEPKSTSYGTFIETFRTAEGAVAYVNMNRGSLRVIA